LKVYFLGFVKQGSKISYTSSVASEIPNDRIGPYKKYLSSFRISVREEVSAKELLKALGYKLPVVLEPTLLLSSKDWLNYAKRPAENIHEQFIFVYDIYRAKKLFQSLKRQLKGARLSMLTMILKFFLKRISTEISC